MKNLRQIPSSTTKSERFPIFRGQRGDAMTTERMTRNSRGTGTSNPRGTIRKGKKNSSGWLATPGIGNGKKRRLPAKTVPFLKNVGSRAKKTPSACAANEQKRKPEFRGNKEGKRKGSPGEPAGLGKDPAERRAEKE